MTPRAALALVATMSTALACRAPDTAPPTGALPAAPGPLTPTSAPSIPAAALPAPGAAVLVGAGDIADCRSVDDERTAALVASLIAARPSARVFVAGDNAYDTGSIDEYRRCYLPSWGAFVDRTIAAPGNHDWLTANAEGFRRTFGVDAHQPLYRAHDVGPWRVIVVDSDCATGDACSAGSPQLGWLAGELARHRQRCTLVIAHHPRFSSGYHGPSVGHQPLWDVVVAGGTDVVINGHDHHYERFGPLDAAGSPTANGPRAFIVGTGGRSAYPLRTQAAAGSELRLAGQAGVILLTLEEAGYRFAFVTVDGVVADQGQGACGP